MNTRYHFRVNGIIITEIIVRPVMLDGVVDHWELVACHQNFWASSRLMTTRDLPIPRCLYPS